MYRARGDQEKMNIIEVIMFHSSFEISTGLCTRDILQRIEIYQLGLTIIIDNADEL